MSHSDSGYTVKSEIPHSGYKKVVYWSDDLQEARRYAEMIVRDNGHTFNVHLERGHFDGEKTLCWLNGRLYSY